MRKRLQLWLVEQTQGAAAGSGPGRRRMNPRPVTLPISLPEESPSDFGTRHNCVEHNQTERFYRTRF
jgi:hypothetical protein